VPIKKPKTKNKKPLKLFSPEKINKLRSQMKKQENAELKKVRDWFAVK
jgi:hypothetical protein